MTSRIAAGLIVILMFAVFAPPGRTQIVSSPSISLRDVPYAFDSQKLGAAKDGFMFFRSFADYFYLVAKENEATIAFLRPPAKLSLPTAVCLGDAHPENFGFLLLKNGASFFTINDIDDSEVAPAAVDLFRFLVGAQLFDSAISIDGLLDAYLDGVENKFRKASTVVDDMRSKSESRSTEPNQNDVDHGKFIQPIEARALDIQEMAGVTSTVQNILGNWSIIDHYAIKKVGGGSGGMLRFEVLLSSRKGKLLHIEFKEQTSPSILPFVSSPAKIVTRISRALEATLESKVDLVYQVVTIAGREMLVRPRYSAHVGVNLSKNSAQENRDLIDYEAFTLGQLHRKTISDMAEWIRILKAAPRNDWEYDVTSMAKFVETKFRSLP